jgi:uncharacterized protein
MAESQKISGCSVPSVVNIRWGGKSLELHADRAIYWRQQRTLIIADPHFGKAAAFRANGVPVPAGTTHKNLARLSNLIQLTAATRLLVLGDFFHAAAGRADQTMQSIACWRREFSQLEVLLVRGNHDQHAGDPPCEWDFTCVDEPMIVDTFSFRHTPEPDAGGSPLDRFTFAGHIHPCVILRDRTGASMRSACFHVSKRQLILPAFGAFTGTHPVTPRKGDRLFAVSDGEIIEAKTIGA